MSTEDQKFHECHQTEVFAMIRQDLGAVRDDIKCVRSDLKVLLDFRSKVVLGLTIGTGIVSGIWALIIRLI